MPSFCRQQFALCLVIVFSLGSLPSVHGEPPPGAAKSKSELLVDDGRFFFILTDRKERVTDFFQRNRVVVGAIWQKRLDKLAQAKQPIGKIFLDYTSANDDPEKAERYGDSLTLAPLAPGVAALIDKHAAPRGKDGNRSVNVVLRRDADKADLYHVVGLTTHTPVSFFTLKEKLKGDDFAPIDLTYKGK